MIMARHPDDPLERFEAFLAGRGKPLTRERRLVAEVALSKTESFDIDQILRDMSDRVDGRRVSRATVLRALVYMSDAGILQQIAVAGRTVFARIDLAAG